MIWVVALERLMLPQPVVQPVVRLLLIPVVAVVLVAVAAMMPAIRIVVGINSIFLSSPLGGDLS